ncbi:structural maintenance of chromosomes protein 3-like isoform X3 [Lycium barbarum]|uniref:structural maintenance of chromosomes protein 3-like isoform X3 n=1 Tax=Lycium barbarum TaxID=112863 RepID=UPI00293EDBE1|nr:structural maintenance of chromosomes protein 3-like isoform X3 [Lycium barbarum]
MYIKQVIIEGYKSYKEQVATEDFSPRVNCVAIRFIVSHLFHNLRSEERQALLHEGAGHPVLSAFVEIVFLIIQTIECRHLFTK